MSDHIDTRRKLKEIPRKAYFDALLEQSTLSEEDKQILCLHYLEDKSLGYIADILGYAETTVKKRHRKALSKLNKLL